MPSLRNIEEGKTEEKSWYQYFFLGLAQNGETSEEGKERELLAPLPVR